MRYSIQCWQVLPRLAFWCLFLLASPLISLLTETAAAATWTVNPEGTGDFATIQGAVNGAEDGDVIELQNGIYAGDGNRDINYWGKAITIRSASGQPESCIIDCQGSSANRRRGFYFATGEGSDSVLEGVTITSGFESTGGGILCASGAGPLIQNCVLLENQADAGATVSRGGGIYCLSGASPALIECQFLYNEATWFGGGLNCDESATPEIEGCTFAGNRADRGGGIFFRASQGASLSGCTFSENSAGYGSGIYLNDGSDISLTSVLIVLGLTGEAIYIDGSSAATLTACDLYGNEGGDWVETIASQAGIRANIAADPLFCTATPGLDRNWSLDFNSPCSSMATGGSPIGAWDIGCGDDAVSLPSWGGIKMMYQSN